MRCAARAPAPVASPAPAPETGSAAAALALYDSGRYDEARPHLEQIDAGGDATGPLLYRLGVCYDHAGDTARRNATMQRALTLLEAEAATANRLEVSFFLANAYGNLGRATDAQKAALEAVTQLQDGAWPRPSEPIDWFRFAKLHQDLGRRDDAVAAYQRALDGWRAAGAAVPGYERWARRYLGADAFARADWPQAEADYAALVAAGGASPADHDRLAVARVRQAKWGPAAEAWREAERLDPANADRARYCRNLARLAEGTGPLPATTPAGSPWSAASKEDLEAILADQAATLRTARFEAAAGLSAERRAELETQVARARANFVAAGVEYAARQLNIRETAFVGGYAPLIFHPEEWKLPAD
jgi:tetratricopeptide (TPR) repeat protein